MKSREVSCYEPLIGANGHLRRGNITMCEIPTILYVNSMNNFPCHWLVAFVPLGNRDTVFGYSVSELHTVASPLPSVLVQRAEANKHYSAEPAAGTVLTDARRLGVRTPFPCAMSLMIRASVHVESIQARDGDCLVLDLSGWERSYASRA